MTYTLTLTEQQARVLSEACEIMARLGMGQVGDALDQVPRVQPIDWSRWHDDVRAVEAILRTHTGMARGQYRGIWQAADRARVAWDLYAVIRHRLAWDRAIAEGIVASGGARIWPSMFQTHFDEPDHVGPEPLARMAQVATPRAAP